MSKRSIARRQERWQAMTARRIAREKAVEWDRHVAPMPKGALVSAERVADQRAASAAHRARYGSGGPKRPRKAA